MIDILLLQERYIAALSTIAEGPGSTINRARRSCCRSFRVGMTRSCRSACGIRLGRGLFAGVSGLDRDFESETGRGYFS